MTDGRFRPDGVEKGPKRRSVNGSCCPCNDNNKQDQRSNYYAIVLKYPASVYVGLFNTIDLMSAVQN